MSLKKLYNEEDNQSNVILSPDEYRDLESPMEQWEHLQELKEHPTHTKFWEKDLQYYRDKLYGI